jgi:hypothetical protein
VQYQIFIPVEQADGTRDALDHGLQQIVLGAQSIFGFLLLGNVRVSGDEAGQLPVNKQGFALNKVGTAAGLGALDVMRLEFKRQCRDTGDVVFDFPGPYSPRVAGMRIRSEK